MSHEPEPGQYDFSGMLNITDFVLKAQEEDLMVNLRPGPFIDAERDMVSGTLEGKICTLLNLRPGPFIDAKRDMVSGTLEGKIGTLLNLRPGPFIESKTW